MQRNTVDMKSNDWQSCLETNDGDILEVMAETLPLQEGVTHAKPVVVLTSICVDKYLCLNPNGSSSKRYDFLTWTYPLSRYQVLSKYT